MRDDDNDNDTFELLAAPTARVTNRLKSDEQQTEDTDHDREPTNASEQHPKADRDYVDQRLKDYAAFERRASGKTN